jgi:pimeloyl-ACP methyl ester carboxylesterase
MKRKTIFTFILLPIVVATCIAQNHPAAIYQKLHLYNMPGSTDSILSGTYPVFENRETKTGRIINLHTVVVPALHPDSAGTPIFYFEGGPGIDATGDAPLFTDPSIPFRKYHDIVLIDIRGTGNSNPLNCASLQIKAGLKEQFTDMYPAEAVKACHDSLSKKADLKQYTTTHVVEDIEEIRKWLGYGKINICGLSYGTRVALVYMKMYPSSIESCILWSPIPTYGRMPLYHARFAQNSLDKVFDDCTHDSACQYAFPNIKNEFDALLKKGKQAPFSFEYIDTSNKKELLSISWNAFETRLRTMLYTPAGMRQIPYVVHHAYLGNFNPFVEQFPKGVDTNSIAEGLYLCITCAEDVPFIQPGEIDSLTRGTFMGTYRIDQQTGACAQWARGEIPKDFFEPVVSKIPTLILSGGFDPITPTSMAKEIASHLPNSTLVIIPQMSHMFDGLNHTECFLDICLSFINNPFHPTLNLDCIKGMQPGSYRIK